MNPPMHVVLGATGDAGAAITRALVAAGLATRAVNRSGSSRISGATSLAADLTDDDDLAESVRGAATVYLAAQPAYHRWPQEFPDLVSRVISATARAGAKLVMVDNAYGYGPGGSPYREDSPERAADRKGSTRRHMTELLLAAHARGDVPVVIGRASDYFGPGSKNSALTALSITPAMQPSKALRWIGSLDTPHSVAYLPDIGDAYATLGTDPRAVGEIWHLPHGPAVTGRAFLSALNHVLGEERPHKVVSELMLRIAAPFHRISRESLGIVYQWTEPFVLDDSRYRATFGSRGATALEVALTATLAPQTNNESR